MSRLIETVTGVFHQLSSLLTELYYQLIELYYQTKALLAVLMHQLAVLLAELFYQTKILLAELLHNPSASIEKLTGLLHQEYSQYLAWYQGADILTQYLLLAITAGTLFLLWVFFYLSRLTK